MERITEDWIGVLVDYKLRSSYHSVWLIYGKRMGMYSDVAKHNKSVNSNIDRRQHPADWMGRNREQTDGDREWIETENKQRETGYG